MPRQRRRKRPDDEKKEVEKWSVEVCDINDDLSLEIASLANPEFNCSFPAITGQGLWDATMHMVRWLTSGGAGSLRGRRCVELGAGLGLVGLGAACQGATVALTDLALNVPTLEENCRRNAELVVAGGGETLACELDWDVIQAGGEPSDAVLNEMVSALGGPVEIILGSDVTWSCGLCIPLAATVLALCNAANESQHPVEVHFAHTSRHGWGEAGRSPEGEETFALGPLLTQQGFRKVGQTRIGDDQGTYIFHYAHGEHVDA